MPRPTSRTRIPVCSVTENCLVEAYLGQLLKADHRFGLFSLRQHARMPQAQRGKTVFIVDQCSLKSPLCECLRKLRGRYASSKFLVIDYERPREEILRFLFMGAQGYIVLEDVSKNLTRAIVSVAAGQLWVPQEVLGEFVSEVGYFFRKNTHPRQSTTPREDEILELVRRRLSNSEIAELLKIRVSTVKFHVSNILSKLNTSRRELVDIPFRSLRRIPTGEQYSSGYVIEEKHESH